MLRDGIVSSNWVYKNIFGFTEDEIKQEDEAQYLIIEINSDEIKLNLKVMIPSKW